MTTENLQMTITAVDHASAVVDRLMSKMKQLTSMSSKISANPIRGLGSLDTGKNVRDNFTKSQNDAMRGLRQRLAFENRMNSQRIAGERAVAAVQGRTARQQEQQQARQERARRVGESATMASFRRQMAFTSNMARQRATLERDAERSRARSIAAGERQHAAQIRQQIQGHRYLFGLRERMERQERRSTAQAAKSEEGRRTAAYRNLGRGSSHARDAGRGIMDSAKTITVYGGIAGGIVGKIAQTGLSARSRADTAEANLRMFGGQTREQVNEARSGWLNRASIENGFRPADAINAFTETLKAGIPAASAPDVTKSIMGASAGLDLNVADTTKLVGRLSTLTQDPKAFSAGAIDQMLNGIAVVAKVTAADSKELVSSLRRGAGVLGSSRMSGTDLTAFTGTGISAGMQEGKAGTFMDFLVNDLVNAKNSRGQRGKDLASGLSLAGVGGVEQVSRQAANDPTALLLKLFGNMANMDPAKAGKVASLIGMREWRGEILQMMKAFPMLKQTVEAGRDPANGGHLAQARNERLGTLSGLGSQLRATADLAWEAIGGGIEDIVRDIGKFFLDLGKNMKMDVIQAHVRTLLDGFVDGLGFTSITEMLEKTFGKSGGMDFSTLNSFFRFAQGFGQGIREVVDSVMSVVRVFAGQDASAETMGKLAAKIIGFAAALAIISPFVGVIASIGAAFAGIGFAVAGFAKASKGLGLLGGTGAAGGAGMASGVLATAGGLIGVAFLATIADKLGILKAPDMSKGWGRGILDFLDPGLASRVYGDDNKAPAAPAKPDETGKAKARAWIDPPRKVDGPKSIPAQIREKLPVEKTGYVGKSGDLMEAMDRLRQSVDRLAAGWQGVGSKLKLDALTKPATVTRASFSTGSESSSAAASTRALDPARQFGKRFFTPDSTVPSWYGGKGSGGGTMPSVGAGVGPYRGILDHIAQSEGTAGRGDYNASLGYGRFLPGGKETNLTGKTLNEVLALGDHMRRQPGNPNSSALGRYQIVGKTMRGLMRKFGLNGSEKFDEALQDRMGAELVRQRGASPAGLGQEWASLRGQKLARAVELAGRIGQSPAESVTSGLTGSGGSAVDIASKFLGKNENTHRRELSGFVGHDVAGSINAWCARFVNSSLQAAGVKGTGSAMANSFLRWGQGVDAAAVQKGDVAVEHRNKGANATGGHVGLATGNKRINPRTGALEIETISGNHGDEVAKDWTDARKLAIRRDMNAATRNAVNSINGTVEAASRANAVSFGADGMKSSGWQPGAGTANRSVITGVPEAERAISNVPMAPRRPAGFGAGGGGGGGGSLTNHIIVNGAGENPGELANKVQRQISKDWNHRSHDVEFDMA